MHRSRIGVVLIDHPPEFYAAAGAFWTAVRGGERKPGGEDVYESLEPLPGGVELALQRTGEGSTPRLHLDVETDDVEAEIARVVALGAAVRQRRDGYAILTDPGGVVFCVVPVQTGADFDAHATTWD